MYHTHKSYFRPELKMLDLINENFSLLLFLQHFNIDFAVDNLKVEDLCKDYDIDLKTFIIIGNVYNGYFPDSQEVLMIENIKDTLVFLKNSHRFYLEDKYPELMTYLKDLKINHETDDFRLIEKFFIDYFKEVKDHLDYEDQVAFPYFNSLLDIETRGMSTDFSVREYRVHHTDIETKLADLKNLFLKHIKISYNLGIKRKFLNSLLGLEYDLKVHSCIEEKILIPIIERIEAGIND